MVPKAITIAAVGLVLAVAMNSNARAAFPEKDITIIIPTRPGNGFDIYARAVAQYLPKYLPNTVNVIPKNVTGAGGRKGTTELYRASPDGYTFGILNVPGIVIPQILDEGVGYDINKMTILARVAKDKYALVVPKGSPYQSFDSLKKAPHNVRFISMSPGMTQLVASDVAISELDIHVDQLTGYRSIQDILVALIRGDGEAAVTAVTTTIPFFQTGDIKPLVYFDSTSPYPGVPTAKEIGHPDLALLGLERIFAAPPKLPDAQRKVLEAALMKTMADPDLIAWGEKTQHEISALDGQEAKTVLDRITKFFLRYKQFLGAQQ